MPDLIPYSIFITTNNSIYIGGDELSGIYVSFNYLIKLTKIMSPTPINTKSIFVLNDNEIYVQTLFPEPKIIRWILNINIQIPVMDIPYFCYALFIDINNYLYCSLDTRHEIVKKWLGDDNPVPDTTAGTGFPSTTPESLNSPRGIFVDLNSNLYVADCFNNRIQFFQPGKSYGTTVAGEMTIEPTVILNHPTGITIDGDGYLYIVDQSNNRIVRGGSFDFRCILGCAAGGKESYKLLGPQHMAFDSYGNIYVADSNNRRIQKFFYSERSCESETTTTYAATSKSKPMVSHSTKTLVPSLMLWLIIFAVYIYKSLFEKNLFCLFIKILLMK